MRECYDKIKNLSWAILHNFATGTRSYMWLHKTRGSILYFCIAVLKEANSKKSKLNLYIDFLAFNSICLRLSFIELSQKASEGDS